MTVAVPSNQAIPPGEVGPTPYCWPTPGVPGAWGELVGAQRVQAGIVYAGISASSSDALTQELAAWTLTAHDALARLDEYIDELEDDDGLNEAG